VSGLNNQRPHSSLNNLTPYEFIKEHDMKTISQELNLPLAYMMG